MADKLFFPVSRPNNNDCEFCSGGVEFRIARRGDTIEVTGPKRSIS